VAELAEDSVPGLRERKKLRTRATLIDAAMELCLRHGYENTTVEQIAAAADVSPRTFSRYFATKDAVFMTLIDDYSHEVSIELETVAPDIGPLEAMRQAHVAVLTRVASRQVGRRTTERIILMLRVINASDTLMRSAFEFRHDATEIIMAKRLGVDIEDRRRRWSRPSSRRSSRPRAATSSPTPTPSDWGRRSWLIVSTKRSASGALCLRPEGTGARGDYVAVYG
jgi:AcrR family transcriptional regulator